MMKRCMVVVGLMLCGVFLFSGCRAFNSTYASPDADIAAKPLPEKPNASGNKPPASPSTSDEDAPPDYSKDTTVCKTPDGVKVGKNPDKLMSNAGWASPVDGEQVTVSAVKKGLHSATITIQKSAADQSVSTLSFTVKQTAVDKFAVCDFAYSEGKDRSYPGVAGSVMVDQVNAVDGNTITNSGSFVLTFTRSAGATATKIQSIYLGATTPTVLGAAGPELNGSYFTNSLTEETSR